MMLIASLSIRCYAMPLLLRFFCFPRLSSIAALILLRYAPRLLFATLFAASSVTNNHAMIEYVIMFCCRCRCEVLRYIDTRALPSVVTHA